jgi:two-component system nitrate/nitrite response regulator NarL
VPYSVVVADDHPVYLKALSQAFGQCGELLVAGTADDGARALELIADVRPDVAVLDVDMPALSGPVVAARVAALELPTRVLFLSAHQDGATVYDALAAGGYGYVTKDASLREIRDAVVRTAAGVRSLGSGVEHRVVQEIQARAKRLTLRLTAMGKRLHLSPATVKVHLSTLYAKLGVSDRASAVAEAIRRGLVR